MSASSSHQGSDPVKQSMSHAKASTMSQPSKALMDVFWVQWRIMTFPWQLMIFGTSWVSNLLVKFLNAAGAPPVVFKDKLKLQETQRIVEHLHQREDGFRRKLKEMQQQIDDKDQDCKRLEKKLSKANSELVRVPTGRAESAELPVLNAPPPNRIDLHFLFWAAGALPAYWLLNQSAVPSISRKFVWSIVAPEALIYTFDLLGSGPPGVQKIIPAMSVFLSGFVFCHWLHAHC